MNRIEVIPSINVRTFVEVRERIKKVEPYVSWAHLDVTDGVFSKHPTWREPQDLLNFKTKLNLEVHLMVENPETIFANWLIGSIKRVIVHLEAVKNLDFIIQKCHEAGVEIGLALNPETPWNKAGPWFKKVDTILVLTVHPGPSGQPVAEDAFKKVASIHKSCPRCIIEFDGGVNPHTHKNAIVAGASILITGAYIFNSKDIGFAIEELKK